MSSAHTAYVCERLCARECVCVGLGYAQVAVHARFQHVVETQGKDSTDSTCVCVCVCASVPDAREERGIQCVCLSPARVCMIRDIASDTVTHRHRHRIDTDTDPGTDTVTQSHSHTVTQSHSHRHRPHNTSLAQRHIAHLSSRMVLQSRHSSPQPPPHALRGGAQPRLRAHALHTACTRPCTHPSLPFVSLARGVANVGGGL
eukprot:3941248-Rhodomonas_salina.1